MNGKRKSEEIKRTKKTLGTTKDIFSLLLYNQCSMRQRAKTAEHEVQSTNLLLKNVVSAGLRKKKM